MTVMKLQLVLISKSTNGSVFMKCPKYNIEYKIKY